MFQVVDGEVVVAVEAYEIMAVALVVAEEEVLAVDAAVVLPPAFCLLYGLAFGIRAGRCRLHLPGFERIFHQSIGGYSILLYPRYH